MSKIPGFKSLPLPLAQLSLVAVLKCGQSFRWSILTSSNATNNASTPEESHLDVEYRFCLKDRVVCLRQSSDTLFYRSVFPDPQPSSKALQTQREAETLQWLNDYFQLNIDLVRLYKQWAAQDKVFAGFQDRFGGIRILRQDPWENLVSFICSSNNNISRITKMVQNLCLHYSQPLLSLPHPFSPNETLAYHSFPIPSALAGSGVGLHLRTLGFGYRADYIHRTAKMLVETHGVGTSASPFGTQEAPEIWLERLRKKTTEEAREELLKFIGVGRKVADCILLMSLDKREVVPVDTHVHQIALKHYGLKSSGKGKTTMTPKLYEEVHSKFFTIWGDYAGWAHTVLFTADLKSFSDYGLPASASPSPVKAVQARKGKSKPSTPLPNTPTLKRKVSSDVEDSVDDLPSFQSPSISSLCEQTTDSLTLVERVKRRRTVR
ncbi:DNA glycosylase [Panaeolus papilionaceus]|nr:DNA glycosylase [Panaeolus papilionaceus]